MNQPVAAASSNLVMTEVDSSASGTTISCKGDGASPGITAGSAKNVFATTTGALDMLTVSTTLVATKNVRKLLMTLS